jgi:hypothetical protein
MKIQSLLLICILLFISLACGGIGLAYEHDLTADYAVWAPDLLEQAAVVQKSPQGSSASVIVPAMVIAYGWDDAFIIAQRHPEDGLDEVDENLTEWYILVVADGSLHGPLTETAYLQQRQKLGVPDTLQFSQWIDADENP